MLPKKHIIHYTFESGIPNIYHGGLININFIFLNDRLNKDSTDPLDLQAGVFLERLGKNNKDFLILAHQMLGPCESRCLGPGECLHSFIQMLGPCFLVMLVML